MSDSEDGGARGRPPLSQPPARNSEKNYSPDDLTEQLNRLGQYIERRERLQHQMSKTSDSNSTSTSEAEVKLDEAEMEAHLEGIRKALLAQKQSSML